MLLETLSQPFKKALATNATNTTFPSKVVTATEPTNDGVLNLTNEGATIQNGVCVVPYGSGDDNDVFRMRIIGWRPVGLGVPTTALWVPVILVELECTLSAAVGVAGKTIVATERFADTITLITGNDDISVDIVSPTGDVIAHALADLKGFRKIEFTFDMLTGDPTDANCLYAFV